MKAFYLLFCLGFSTFFSFCYGQVTFDGGNTYYVDSSQSILCNGKFRTFYPKFKLKTSTNYENGKMAGEFVEYFPDGKIKAQFNYKDNLIEGEAVEYYPEEGILKSKYHFLHGEKHGICIDYNEMGELIESKNYVNGVAED
jgi:uncharacterized protein